VSVIDHPFAEVPLSAPAKFIPAEPAAVSEPANADVATSEPANAVKPIFFNVHINYSFD
jgi:hypothetical protein